MFSFIIVLLVPKTRSEGNEFFKRQDYANAVQKYGEAIEIDGTNHVYYSNRRCGREDYRAVPVPSLTVS